MSGRKIAAILLAAGRGTRFGGAKLRADLGGVPVACHAAATLAAQPVRQRLAVVSGDTPDLSTYGFAAIRLDPPDAPLSRSIAAGVAAAGEADAYLIALADMPLVPAAHFSALFARFDGDRIATHAGSVSPPALFGRAHRAALIALEADRGARALLRNSPVVALDPTLALDIDTPADLAEARTRLAALRA